MKRNFSVLGLLVLLHATAGIADVLEVDGAHSSATFTISHMVVAKVKGTVTGAKGTFTTDPKDITKLKVEATLDPATISTRDEKRDAHLKGPDFFDVAKNPVIAFKSTKVVKKGGDKFELTGDLTIHGVTKSVTLAAEGLDKEVTDPWGNKKRGFSATGKVNRKDFGMVWNQAIDKGGFAVGDIAEVEIELELKAQKEVAKGEKKN